jgi:dTDP-4-dehydrorhamnose reductase
MLELTASRPQLNVVSDQTGTPTYALDLAEVICHIVESGKTEGNEGIYHYSNEGVCSWYDFAKAIAGYSGNDGCEIRPCTSDEYPSPVRRPFYSVLDKTKIKDVFGIEVPLWTDSLRKCLKNLL